MSARFQVSSLWPPSKAPFIGVMVLRDPLEAIMSVNGVAATCSTEGASSTRGARGHRPLPDEVVKALADKLGMSADDLKSKLEAGGDGRKVLDQLAEEKGISKQELRETIRSAMPNH